MENRDEEIRIDWKSKLTSRKFWLAVCGLVSGILMALKMDEQEVTQISGIIMAAASVVAYIIGEGLADAAHAADQAQVIEVAEEAHPPEDQEEDDLK